MNEFFLKRVINFSPQAIDMYVHGIAPKIRISVPDMLQEKIPREHFAPIENEKFK